MTKSRMIPVEYFIENMEYREETINGVRQGNVYWKRREDMSNQWNGKHAGKRLGCVNGRGYNSTKIKYNGSICNLQVHTVVWILNHNRYPDITKVIDHIDRNKENNLIENLREIFAFENNLNSAPVNNSNKTSNYKGVRYKYNSNKWETIISKNKLAVFCKTVVDELEAALLYNQEVVKHHNPDYVYLNDISSGYTNTEFPNRPRGWSEEKVAA